jgi:RNA polymerase sigma-70 factor (ECF subfamily)
VLNNLLAYLVFVKSEDQLLIAEALGGNEKAYSSLTAKYWKRVFSFLRRKVNDNATAEELTQDTFASAFRYLHTFRGDSQFYTWLCTIAINKASKRPFDSFKSEVDSVTSVTPETLLNTKQEFAQVLDSIDKLPEKQRKALYMKHVEGMCYNDIGVALNCSSKHAKNLVYKAKKTIRSSYDQ